MGFVTNVEKAKNFAINVASVTAEYTFAVAFHFSIVRDAAGRSVLSQLYPNGNACFTKTVGIDLDADGVQSDLVVFFRRATDGSHCNQANSPNVSETEDVAVFKKTGIRLRFVGSPPYSSYVGHWNIVGPAIFRITAASSNPSVEIYMYWDNKLNSVESIDTTSAEEYRGTKFMATRGGKGAMVVNNAGISEVYFSKSHRGVVERLTARRLKAELAGSHLLSFDFDGLKFDDAPLTKDRPKEGDAFEIKIAPGDRLYVVGCRDEAGFKEDQLFPGAIIPDFSTRPWVACRLSEEASFQVTVKPAETY